MSINFHLRVEYGPFHQDYKVGADTLELARARLQARLPDLHVWEWRGAVAFVEGTTPAEEMVLDARISTIVHGSHASLRLKK